MSTIPTTEAAGLSPADWDRVNEQVQVVLAPLNDLVRRQLADVRSESGRTGARAWFLFSYREFLWPDEPEGVTEAVVVGVTFAPAPDGNGIRVRGEISGGETGHVYHETEEREVPPPVAAVLPVALEIAGQLSSQTEILVNALRQRRPPPDYRNTHFADSMEQA